MLGPSYAAEVLAAAVIVGVAHRRFGWILLPLIFLSISTTLSAIVFGGWLRVGLWIALAAGWHFLWKKFGWLFAIGLRKEKAEALSWSARWCYQYFGIIAHATKAAPLQPPPLPGEDEAVAVASHRASADRFSIHPLKLVEGRPAKDDIVLILDPSVRYQTFMGFGTSLTESSAKTLCKMGSANQERIVDAYFNKDSGLGFTMARVHMNSCDFSDGNWSCCEKSGDTELETFSVERYEETILPLARRAMTAAGKALTVLASPWSPPAWMKTTGAMCGGGKLRKEFREAWAKHYVRFAEAFKEKGIPLWGFTVQNEPDGHTPWENCLYGPEEERDFIRDHLGPALASSNMDLKLVAWDHNRDELFDRARTIYSDPEAAKYVWGMGWHWYGDPRYEWWPDPSGRVCFDNVRKVHELRPDKHLIVTETCQENGPHIGDWSVAERYAESIIKDLNNWCEAWIDWNMILDPQGGPNHVGNMCSAPIIADAEVDRVLFQPSYFAFGHFSRHIRPGATRILSAINRDFLETTAFENPDGTLAVVVLNQTHHSKGFNIVIYDKLLRAWAPAHCIITFIINARAPPAKPEQHSTDEAGQTPAGSEIKETQTEQEADIQHKETQSVESQSKETQSEEVKRSDVSCGQTPASKATQSEGKQCEEMRFQQTQTGDDLNSNIQREDSETQVPDTQAQQTQASGVTVSVESMQTQMPDTQAQETQAGGGKVSVESTQTQMPDTQAQETQASGATVSVESTQTQMPDTRARETQASGVTVSVQSQDTQTQMPDTQARETQAGGTTNSVESQTVERQSTAQDSSEQSEWEEVSRDEALASS